MSSFQSFAEDVDYVSRVNNNLNILEKPAAFVGASLVHAATSIYNSGIEVGNLIGLDIGEENKLNDKGITRKLFGNAVAEFYGENKETIDTVSDIGSLFIPGTLAVKSMRAATALTTGSKGIGKYYAAFDAVQYQRRFEKAAAAAAEGTGKFGDYTKVWNETRKAYLAGAVAGLQESAGATALSYAMLKDTQLFEDADFGDFVWESALGGGIVAPFKYIGTKALTMNALRGANEADQAVNFIPEALKQLSPAENIVYMLGQRSGVAFTDETASNLFTAGMRTQFEKMIPDEAVRKEFETYFGGLATRAKLGAPDLHLEARDWMANLKGVSLPKVDEMQEFGFRLGREVKSGKITPLKDTLADDAQDFVEFVRQPNAQGGGVVYSATAYASTPIFQKVGEEVFTRLAEKLGAGAVQRGTDSVKVLTRDLYFVPEQGGKSAGLGDLKILRTLKDLGVESASPDVGYLDLLTGQVNLEPLLTAREYGVKLLAGGVQMGTKFLGKKDFTRPINDVAEADALHIWSTHVGGNAELVEKIFARGRGAGYKEVVGDKTVRTEFGFDLENLFEAQAAQEYASVLGGGRAPIFAEGKVIGFKSADEIGKVLTDLKTEKGVKYLEAGYSEREVSVLLNGDSAKNIYSGGKTAGKPRFLRLEYGDAPDRNLARAEMLAKTTEAFQEARLLETVGKATSQYLNWDTMPKLLRGVFGADNTGAFGFSGKRGASTAQGAVEELGVWVNQNKKRLANAMNSPLIPVNAHLANNIVDRITHATFMNEIRARPAGLRLVGNPKDGKTYFFDDATQDFAVNVGGARLPAVEGKVLDAFTAMIQGPHKIYAEMMNAKNAFLGNPKRIDPNVLYAPALPTGQFFAEAVFPGGGRRFIDAANEADLAEKIEVFKKQYPQVSPDSIRVRGEIGAARKAAGEFYGEDFYNNVMADISQERTGAAASALVSSGTETLESVANFYEAAAAHFTRFAAEKANAAAFGELRTTQQRLDATKLAYKGGLKEKFFGASDDYNRAINTALDKSNINSYELWAKANQSVAQVLSAGNQALVQTLDKFAAVLPGTYLSEAKKAAQFAPQLNDFSRKFGMNTDFGSVATNLKLTNKFDPQAGQRIISQTNLFFATGQLGIDTLNTAVNFLSYGLSGFPELLNLRRQLARGEVKGLENIAVKDLSVGGVMQISMHKLVENTLLSWGNWGKRAPEYIKKMERHVELGIVDEQTMKSQILHEELAASFATRDPLAIETAAGKLLDGVRNVLVERPNQFMRHVMADTTEQILRASGITDEKFIAMRAAQTVRRTQHNFISSQRPVAFQGPIGAAISLYQTFMFNAVQNIARYAGEGDSLAIKAFMGMQTATFGLQSNPIFHAANSTIAMRAGNTDRNDLYSSLQDADSLLYGPISANLDVNLYGRGDLTPRTAVLLPTEIVGIPAIAQAIQGGRAIGTFASSLSSAFPGGEPGRVGDAFLTAVQQSGFSRPLAGIAAAVQGQTVDQRGNKLADTELFSLATAVRALGGKPFDEAKLRDLQWRANSYRIKDAKLLEKLGAKVKGQIRANGTFETSDWADFQTEYVQAGGEMKNMKAWILRQNVSVDKNLAARLEDKFKNDPDMQPWLLYINQEAAGE